MTIKNGHNKILVTNTTGLSAYRISTNSNLITTDTIIRKFHIVYKSVTDSIYIFSKKNSFYLLTTDYKKSRLIKTDIKSDKPEPLRLMINNLDSLIGY